MSHEDTLNTILAHSCSNPTEFDDYLSYRIDLHCFSFIVIAKPLGNLKYEIKSVTPVTSNLTLE